MVGFVDLKNRGLEILFLVDLGAEVDILDELFVANVHDLVRQILAYSFDPEIIHDFYLVKYFLLVLELGGFEFDDVG